MTEEVKNKKPLFKRLKYKYRLVIVNDDTFEEKFSIKLSRLNVFTLVGSSAILLVVITSYVIAYTPLREYIPGYMDSRLRRNALKNAIRIDSLNNRIRQNEEYIKSIKSIIPDLNQQKNQQPSKDQQTQVLQKKDTVKKDDDKISEREQNLRNKVESESTFNLKNAYSSDKNNSKEMSSILFFPPLKGVITKDYSLIEKHFAIDIASDKSDAIKATLDGNVILAQWTMEDGYVIGIQHKNNFVSYYKHNSKLLKKTGEFVKAGEAIAIEGDSGEKNNTRHLHFELWLDGKPVNPRNYVML